MARQRRYLHPSGKGSANLLDGGALPLSLVNGGVHDETQAHCRCRDCGSAWAADCCSCSDKDPTIRSASIRIRTRAERSETSRRKEVRTRPTHAQVRQPKIPWGIGIRARPAAAKEAAQYARLS